MIFIRFSSCSNPAVVVQVSQSKSQFGASIFFFVTIMALLICSNETNITTFHDPNLRNEGTNLQETKRRGLLVTDESGSTNVSTTNEGKASPFVESRWPLFGHHGPGAVDSTLVLAWR